MESFLQGFVVCFGLIVSIGAQNAFVLRQGILKQHVFAIAMTCFFCDVLLMGLGVLGLGTLIAQSPMASLILSLLGAIFLLTYGSRSFISSYKGINQLEESQDKSAMSLKKALMITLAITLLNPHVYVDTVVIVGGIGSTLNFEQKLFFLSGALLCSFIWFLALGYGAGLLSHYFKKRRTWQLLDCATGVIMYGIAISLIIYASRYFI